VPHKEWIMKDCARVLLSLTALFVLCGAAFAKSPPAGLQLQLTPAGVFLLDAQGATLYFDGRDEGGAEPACDKQCAKEWTPVVADEKSTSGGEWSIVKGPGESKQWAYKNRRLYKYVKDTHPGARFGDGWDNIWQLAFVPVSTPPGIEVVSTVNGYMLVNSDGNILYTMRDGTDAKTCAEDCVLEWTPVTAPLIGFFSSPWSIVSKRGGEAQWAYQGKALYAGSVHHARTTETGLAADLALGWQAQILLPGRPKPSWVITQASDMGRILADQTGATLYAYEGELKGMMETACDAACLKENWKPVAATGNEKPVGDWSVIGADGGKFQWAHKGNPLYTYLKDEKPGNVRGDRFGTYAKHSYVKGSGWWRPLLASCVCAPP
jgi:predicted lipoprotein with Yx(FWY)xxD motif